MRRALSEFTTIRLGGDASVFEAKTQAELVEVLRDAPDIRILGGGSNVVAADEGVREPVVRITASGWTRHDDQFVVAAGTPWDEFVAAMVEAGRYGVEALSGIPGSTGATPIQNVGAYGQEVSETIAGLRVLDRRSGEITTWPAARAELRLPRQLLQAESGLLRRIGGRLRSSQGLQRTDQVRRTGA